ncbi:MAG: HEAT repeat domain-containing protein [Gemmatimonadaceae bacterium]
MTLSALSPAHAAAEAELPAPPFPTVLVTDLLNNLGRAIRAHQLYLHNNPTYLKTLEATRRAFAAVWEHAEEVAFEITETQLKWEGRVVLNEPDKASDNLPWLLYKDGLRELRLARDVEHAELTQLIDLLCRVRRALPDEDDLLTLLWEHEFSGVRYRYVDLALEAAPIEQLDEEARRRLKDSAEDAQPLEENILPAGVVNLDAFDATLYFLDDGEIEYLRDAIRKEYGSDLRSNVIAALMDIYETQAAPEVREEVLRIFEGLLLSFLAAGQFSNVAYMLREARSCADRALALTAEQGEALRSLAGRLSDQETLPQLLQSLDERADLPSEDDLKALFEELRPGAIGIAFSWLGKLQSPKVRAILAAAADRLAAANTAELVRLIGSPERGVTLEAVRRAGAMRANAAVPALAKLQALPDAELRLAAVTALGEIASPGALQHLEKGLEDAEREIRVVVAKVFAARAHRPALGRIEALIKSRRLASADLTERMAFFEAYGAMCGDGGVAVLDGYLNGKRLLGGKRSDPELRACAARALGMINSERASAALRKASEDKEVLVRSAVNKALRGGDR